MKLQFHFCGNFDRYVKMKEEKLFREIHRTLPFCLRFIPNGYHTWLALRRSQIRFPGSYLFWPCAWISGYTQPRTIECLRLATSGYIISAKIGTDCKRRHLIVMAVSRKFCEKASLYHKGTATNFRITKRKL